MKHVTSWTLALVFLSLCPCNGSADEVTYVRKLNDQEAAAIISGEETKLSVGTVIPGQGTVVRITDKYLIVERRLTDLEKQDLERQGAAVYEVLETRIPRYDLRIVIGQPLPPDK